MISLIRNALLRLFQKRSGLCGLAICQRTLRTLLLSLGSEPVLKALDYHFSQLPYKNGTGFIGYIDSVAQVGDKGRGLYEIRGWLFHESKTVVALTFFDGDGAPYAVDYGFPRADLVSVFPHLNQAPMSGFRLIMPGSRVHSAQPVNFRAVLSNDTVQFGAFPALQPA